MIRTMVRVGLGVMAMTIAVRAGTSPVAEPQQAAPPPAAAAWRNLQVMPELRAAPALDLYDAMDFMAGSLGVSCDYCHRLNAYDMDVKATKARARDMIRMMRAINDANFGGRATVTCNTCHRGHPTPASVPSPWYRSLDEIAAYQRSLPPEIGATPRTPASATPAEPLPSADTVLANYRQAVGGPSLRSVKLTGTFTGEQVSGAIEYLALFPDQFQITRTFSGNTTRQIFNRDHGWLTAPDVRVPMATPDFARLMQDVRMKLFLPPAGPASGMTVTGLEAVDSRPCYVLSLDTPLGPERWYVDRQSWLLVKVRRETPTRLGTAVRETEWRDFRDVGGTKLPFKMLEHGMANEVDTTFASIDTNVAVDPATFEPPPVEKPSVTLSPADLDAVSGRYELAPGTVVTITHEGAQLFLTQPNGVKTEVLASSATEFFLRNLGVTLTVHKSASGEVASLTLKQGTVTRECPEDQITTVSRVRAQTDTPDCGSADPDRRRRR